MSLQRGDHLFIQTLPGEHAVVEVVDWSPSFVDSAPVGGDVTLICQLVTGPITGRPPALRAGEALDIDGCRVGFTGTIRVENVLSASLRLRCTNLGFTWPAREELMTEKTLADSTVLTAEQELQRKIDVATNLLTGVGQLNATEKLADATTAQCHLQLALLFQSQLHTDRATATSDRAFALQAEMAQVARVANGPLDEIADIVEALANGTIAQLPSLQGRAKVVLEQLKDEAGQ